MSELQRQRDFLIANTHVRGEPSKMGEGCLVVRMELGYVYISGLGYCEPNARFILSAIREMDFPGLKAAIRHARKDFGNPLGVRCPITRHWPSSVVTRWNDHVGIDPIGILDRAIVLEKEYLSEG